MADKVTEKLIEIREWLISLQKADRRSAEVALGLFIGQPQKTLEKAKKGLTEAQKQKRREYSKKRNERIKLGKLQSSTPVVDNMLSDAKTKKSN